MPSDALAAAQNPRGKLGIIDDLGNPSLAHELEVTVGQAFLAWMDHAADLRHSRKGVAAGDSILNFGQYGRRAIDQSVSVSVSVLRSHDPVEELESRQENANGRLGAVG